MLIAVLRGLAAGVMLFTTGSIASAQDKVLGLLSLPEAFGYGPCQAFAPEVVALYEAPSATASSSASIQVDQHWSFAPHGGCEGLKVSVHRGAAREELPTLEYANESPAAVVLGVRDGWVKIRLANGSAWLRPTVRGRFMPMAELFSEYVTLTKLTDAHHGPLREKPAEDGGGAAVPARSPVRVLEFREAGNETWLRVALMSHSICDAETGGPPEVKSLGWVRAHSPSGEPTVWFSARGC
jgi:hypothetical protein